MDCPPGQKSGRYREVAVSGGSTVLLYYKIIKLILVTIKVRECVR